MEPRPAGRESLTVTRALGIVIVTLRGHVDAHLDDLLRHVLADLIEDQGNRDLIVDVEHAQAVSATTVAVISSARDRMRGRGGTLRLSYGLTPTDALAASA